MMQMQGSSGVLLMNLSMAFEFSSHEASISKLYAYGFDRD